MASSINVAGSFASAMAFERFLMSPTPIMTGVFEDTMLVYEMGCKANAY
jgi:hypothetical protein